MLRHYLLTLFLLSLLLPSLHGQAPDPVPFLECPSGTTELYSTDFITETSSIDGLTFGYGDGESREWTVSDTIITTPVTTLGRFDLSSEPLTFAFRGIPEVTSLTYNVHYLASRSWDGNVGSFSEALEWYHGPSAFALEEEFATSVTNHGSYRMCFPLEYPCGGDEELPTAIDDPSWIFRWFGDTTTNSASMFIRSVTVDEINSESWQFRLVGDRVEGNNEYLSLYKVQLCGAIVPEPDDDNGLSPITLGAIGLGGLVLVGLVVGALSKGKSGSGHIDDDYSGGGKYKNSRMTEGSSGTTMTDTSTGSDVTMRMTMASEGFYKESGMDDELGFTTVPMSQFTGSRATQSDMVTVTSTMAPHGL